MLFSVGDGAAGGAADVVVVVVVVVVEVSGAFCSSLAQDADKPTIAYDRETAGNGRDASDNTL